jgi:hypothetical protein
MLTIILLAACKKSNDNEDISLMGKWIFESSVLKEYENGILINTETETADGTTFDFQNNGHLVIASPGSSPDSVPYSLKPDSKVDIDGDITEIRNLTSNTVTLYLREDYGQGDYGEFFINLKR